MNWSYPAAISVLKVMQRNGWTCTAWQLESADRTAAPHSDVAGVRELMCTLGAPDWRNSVSCTQSGTSTGGDGRKRKVFVYALRSDCIRLARIMLGFERSRGDAAGSRPDFRVVREGLAMMGEHALSPFAPTEPPV